MSHGGSTRAFGHKRGDKTTLIYGGVFLTFKCNNKK